MTFFNKRRKKFYGRTVITEPVPLLVENEGSLYQTQNPINVYFHSRIEKGDENVLAIEAQLLELDDLNLVRKETNLGWTYLRVYNPQAAQSKTMDFYEGTPRMLLDSDILDYEYSSKLIGKFV